MKRDRFCHAMHREIAKDIAALRAGLLHAPTFERHRRKFFHVEELCAAEMIVPFFDARIEAAHIDLRCDRGILGMLAINFDPAAKISELAPRRAEELMHAETDRRAGLIEPVNLLRPRDGGQTSYYGRNEQSA